MNNKQFNGASVSLGQKVYCIYGNYILCEKVYAIGKESFIITPFNNRVNFDSHEWWFKDYKWSWFDSLEEAKEFLLKDYPKDKYHIVQTKADSRPEGMEEWVLLKVEEEDEN